MCYRDGSSHRSPFERVLVWYEAQLWAAPGRVSWLNFDSRGKPFIIMKNSMLMHNWNSTCSNLSRQAEDCGWWECGNHGWTLHCRGVDSWSYLTPGIANWKWKPFAISRSNNSSPDQNYCSILFHYPFKLQLLAGESVPTPSCTSQGSGERTQQTGSLGGVSAMWRWSLVTNFDMCGLFPTPNSWDTPQSRMGISGPRNAQDIWFSQLSLGLVAQNLHNSLYGEPWAPLVWALEWVVLNLSSAKRLWMVNCTWMRLTPLWMIWLNSKKC
jgi:hypothetical protein